MANSSFQSIVLFISVSLFSFILPSFALYLMVTSSKSIASLGNLNESELKLSYFSTTFVVITLVFSSLIGINGFSLAHKLAVKIDKTNQIFFIVPTFY